MVYLPTVSNICCVRAKTLHCSIPILMDTFSSIFRTTQKWDWYEHCVTMYHLLYRDENSPLFFSPAQGKTLQTIALLAYLAAYKGIWGPHLIVVPTSVILNWETELKRFCPALKVLCYYGSAKRRKELRQGWTKSNWHHVVITSYQLAVQDSFAFKRKRWYCTSSMCFDCVDSVYCPVSDGSLLLLHLAFLFARLQTWFSTKPSISRTFKASAGKP